MAACTLRFTLTLERVASRREHRPVHAATIGKDYPCGIFLGHKSSLGGRATEHCRPVRVGRDGSKNMRGEKKTPGFVFVKQGQPGSRASSTCRFAHLRFQDGEIGGTIHKDADSRRGILSLRWITPDDTRRPWLIRPDDWQKFKGAAWAVSPIESELSAKITLMAGFVYLGRNGKEDSTQ